MWSKQFSSCKSCGTTERPHLAKGLCGRCYLRDYNTVNAERLRLAKHVRYVANVELASLRGKEYRARKAEQIKERRKRYRAYNKEKIRVQKRTEHDVLRFDGRREAVLKRDDYRCTVCCSAIALVVHHKDGSGQSTTPNNKLSNLTTLCRKCHQRAHHRLVDRWSRKHDCCVACQTTAVDHAGLGLCIGCYSKHCWAKKKSK